MIASNHGRGPSWLATLARFAREVPGTGARQRELRDLLDDVADIPWRNPVWAGIVGACALFERFGQPVPVEELHALWLSGDGTPRIDTFMGRRIERRRDATRAGRIARAVVWARAALEAVDGVDGTLPLQPLHQYVAWERRWLCRHPVADRRRVAFLTPRGSYLARVEPGAELALGRDLAAACAAGPVDGGGASAGRLTPIDLDGDAPTPVAIAISLLDVPVDRARHIHRQVWSRGGGPWLGVGVAPPYEVTTTCHLVTDGVGHGLVTRELLDRVDALAELEAAIAADLAPLAPGADLAASAGHRWRHTQSQGVADGIVDGRVSFAEAAYSFGRTLTRVFGDPAARFSPTFQVPIAPAPAGDAHYRRRVVQGLASVRHHDGDFESLDAFAARLPALVARERRGHGPLTRMMQAAACTPAPRPLLRYYLASPVRPGRWSTLKEVLAGRGVLSSMRLQRPAGSPTLYAAAAPPLLTSPDDPRGSVLLTLIHHDGFVTATTTGIGLASSHAGAADILHAWRAELDRVRAAAVPPPGAAGGGSRAG